MENAGTRVREILDTAEWFVRTLGYNGFSFRDVAEEVGIKSASVHYHFPTKADLGAALARRYTDRFLETLGDPADPSVAPEALLLRYTAAFRRALVEQGQMCLCGMLGAEIASLPGEVGGEVRGFFERNVDWLEVVLSRRAEGGLADRAASRRRALALLATLEGALIVARTLGRAEAFDEVVEGAGWMGPASP